MAKQENIFIDPKHKGEFTAKAKKQNMGVQEFATHVLANPKDFDAKTRLQARFAKNSMKFNH